MIYHTVLIYIFSFSVGRFNFFLQKSNYHEIIIFPNGDNLSPTPTFPSCLVLLGISPVLTPFPVNTGQNEKVHTIFA